MGRRRCEPVLPRRRRDVVAAAAAAAVGGDREEKEAGRQLLLNLIRTARAAASRREAMEEAMVPRKVKELRMEGRNEGKRKDPPAWFGARRTSESGTAVCVKGVRRATRRREVTRSSRERKESRSQEGKNVGEGEESTFVLWSFFWSFCYFLFFL